MGLGFSLLDIELRLSGDCKGIILGFYWGLGFRVILGLY